MKLAFIIQVPFITNTSDILQSSIYIAQTFSRVTKAHDGSDNAYCSVNFVKKRHYKPGLCHYQRAEKFGISESDLAVICNIWQGAPKISWQPSTGRSCGVYKCDILLSNILYYI